MSLTYIVVVCFVSCCIGGLDLMKIFIHILLMVSGVFFLIIYRVKFEEKLWFFLSPLKNVSHVFFNLVYLSFIIILLFRISIVGLYLLKNGIPISFFLLLFQFWFLW